MLKGNQIYLRPLEPIDAESTLQLQLANRQFFETYSMTRNGNYYSIEGQCALIQQQIQHRNNDEGYSFGIFKNEDDYLAGVPSN